MVITIDTDELESEFIESWKLGFIRDPHIDYATNCIHAWFENKEVILYRFKECGWAPSGYYGSGANGYNTGANPSGYVGGSAGANTGGGGGAGAGDGGSGVLGGNGGSGIVIIRYRYQ